jgi:transcriptional regulator with XRE-family HTH domain
MKCPHCNGTGELAATFGALVKAARDNAGLTQQAVAERAGLSRPQLANIETDRTDVPLKTLQRIATALDVPAKDLIP